MTSKSIGLLVAAALAGFAVADGCGPSRRAEAPRPPVFLAVVSTTSGTIVERWAEPQLLVDVAEDHATGRVWGIAESGGPAIGGPEGNHPPKIWELFRDKPPEERFELPLVQTDGAYLDVGGAPMFWDTGMIALDPVHRRGMFTSPSSANHILLDLDSGALVGEVVSHEYGHGNTIDVTAGIGYTSGAGSTASYYDDRSSLSVLDSPLCPDMTIPDPNGTYANWTGMVFSEANQKLYVDEPGQLLFGGPDHGKLCTWDAVTGSSQLADITCGPASPNFPDYCGAVGMAVSRDGQRLYIAAPNLIGVPFKKPSFLIQNLADNSQVVIRDNAFPQGFALSPDDSTLYVTELQCNRISAFDAKTGAHLYDVPMDGFTMGIDLSADGKRLYVAQTDTAGFFKISHQGSAGGFLNQDGTVLTCPPIVRKRTIFPPDPPLSIAPASP